MVDRTRKMINKPITSADFNGSTLASIAKQITDLISEYGPNATLDMYQLAYSDAEYLYVYAVVPETDEEMANRIQNEEYLEKYNADYELKEYERLRAKFGDNA